MARASLSIRPWRPGDQTALSLRADFARERAARDWDWRAGPPGPTWTICRPDGAVVAIGGGVAAPDDVWQVWAWFGPVSLRDWPFLLAAATHVMDQLDALEPGYVIEATARYGFSAAVRTLAKLGFVVVGDVEWGALGPYHLLRKVA
ncbi:MAG TPA: hypothetical protein VMU59_09295 [Caulobacteraceae bacterium]|nr:hypothetical protein [Caulobacteraceae bacterium]